MNEHYKETVPNNVPLANDLIEHFCELEKLQLFTDKVEYWMKHLKDLDLFKQLYVQKEDDTEILLTLLPYDRSNELDLYLIRYLLEEPFKNQTMRGHKFIRDFLYEIDGLEVIEDAQKYFINKIDKLNTTTPNRPTYSSDFVQKGYNIFASRYDLETACNKIYNATVNKGLTAYKVIEAFDGFSMAYARKFIKDYTHTIEQPSQIANSFLSGFINPPKASPPHPINDTKGTLHRPKLELTELLILFYALREEKLIAGIYNVSNKHLALSIHLLTGYSYTTVEKNLKSKKEVSDFNLTETKEADLIATLKKFIEDLEDKL